jgi:dihydrolipoamide dehydrogenase
MPTRSVDVAIVGAGTAGLGARRAALDGNASALLIDPGPLGTTCARVGCMPSKLLIAAADAAHDARHAGVFGVRTDVTVDTAAVMQRVRRHRDRFVDSVLSAIDDARADGELLEERAEIVGPGELRCGDTTVHYQRLVIATGSEPAVPKPYQGLPDEVLLDNRTIFELEQLPGRVLVVGAGVVGLELGQALHRLGVGVTVLGKGGHIGPLTDERVRDVATEVFCSELDLHPEHELRSVSADDGGVRVRFVGADGEERDERYDRVLLGAGRRPRLDGLGLQTLGVQRDDDGRWPIDEGTLQLGDQPVFVAGDANDLHPLLHEAIDDGRLAGKNAAKYPDIRAPLRSASLSIVFTRPQLALVGRHRQRLRDEGCDIAIGSVDYSDQGRAKVIDRAAGMVRIYADRTTRRLCGAELCGPDVEHLAHLLAWAVQSGMTVQDALGMPFYHPTVEEGLRTALRELAVELRASKPVDCHVAEEGVGA